jgi:hypothetical protein
MTDLWYTYGAMVADPGLLAAIGNANPIFQLIDMDVTETVTGQPANTYNRPAAGYLDSTSTTNLRQVIRDYVVANLPAGAPPISLYTAGKMCQLWNTHQSGLTDAINDANAAFTRAGGKAAASSTALLTIVGLSLLDTNFVTRYVLSTKPSVVAATAAEFGLNPAGAEWKTVQTLVKDTGFGEAYTELINAPCWKGVQACVEVYAFYVNFIRAVN